MDIEEEILVTYLLIRRMRKEREKKKVSVSVGRMFQEREGKGAFVLFHDFR